MSLTCDRDSKICLQPSLLQLFHSITTWEKDSTRGKLSDDVWTTFLSIFTTRSSKDLLNKTLSIRSVNMGRQIHKLKQTVEKRAGNKTSINMLWGKNPIRRLKNASPSRGGWCENVQWLTPFLWTSSSLVCKYKHSKIIILSQWNHQQRFLVTPFLSLCRGFKGIRKMQILKRFESDSTVPSENEIKPQRFKKNLLEGHSMTKVNVCRVQMLFG